MTRKRAVGKLVAPLTRRKRQFAHQYLKSLRVRREEHRPWERRRLLLVISVSEAKYQHPNLPHQEVSQKLKPRRAKNLNWSPLWPETRRSPPLNRERQRPVARQQVVRRQLSKQRNRDLHREDLRLLLSFHLKRFQHRKSLRRHKSKRKAPPRKR